MFGSCATAAFGASTPTCFSTSSRTRCPVMTGISVWITWFESAEFTSGVFPVVGLGAVSWMTTLAVAVYCFFCTTSTAPAAIVTPTVTKMMSGRRRHNMAR